MKTRLVRVLVLAMVGVAVFASAAWAVTASSQAATGVTVAYARADGNGHVDSFGGKGTSRVTAAGTSPTVVTFTGNYPTGLTLNKVIIQATPYAFSGREATNAYPCGRLTTTTIQVCVFNFDTGTSANSLEPFWINIYIGR